MAFDGNPARFTINGTPSEDVNGNRGLIVANGALMTLALEVIPSTALSARFEIYDPTIPTSPLASLDAPLLTFIGSGMSSELLDDPDNQVSTINMAAAGANPFTDIHAYLIRCTVSTAEGPYSFQRMVVTIGTNSELRKTVPAESQEYVARGWSDELNKMVDLLELGIGGGGGTFLGLTDTPGSYVGFANRLTQVDPTEVGIQFSPASVNAANGDFATPGNGSFLKGLTVGGPSGGAGVYDGSLVLTDVASILDEKHWRVESSGGRLRVQMLDDAFTSDEIALTLERNGMVLESLTVGDSLNPILAFIFGSLQILDRLTLAGLAGSDIVIGDASQPVNEKLWRFRADANLVFQAVNDAIGAPFDILTFDRGAGATVTEMRAHVPLNMLANDITGTGDHYASNFVAVAPAAPSFNGTTTNSPVFVGQNTLAPLLAGGGTQSEVIPIIAVGTNVAPATNGGIWSHFIGNRDPEGNVTADGGSTFIVDSAIASISKMLVKEGDASNTGWRELSKLTDGYIKGCLINYQSVSAVGIESGVCRSDDDRFDILNNGAPLIPNITVAGAGGLDTGVEAASTWYSVWIIANSTTGAVSSLLSTSSTSPTMPAGYDKKRRVGWVYNNAASNFRPFFMSATGRDREVTYFSETRTNLAVFTAQEPTVWTTQALIAWLPPTARRAHLLIEVDAAANDYAEFRRTGSAVANAEGFRVTSASGGLQTMFVSRFPTSNGREIDYRRNNTSGTGVNLFVYGYEDNV